MEMSRLEEVPELFWLMSYAMCHTPGLICCLPIHQFIFFSLRTEMIAVRVLPGQCQLSNITTCNFIASASLMITPNLNSSGNKGMTILNPPSSGSSNNPVPHTNRIRSAKAASVLHGGILQQHSNRIKTQMTCTPMIFVCLSVYLSIYQILVQNTNDMHTNDICL